MTQEVLTVIQEGAKVVADGRGIQTREPSIWLGNRRSGSGLLLRFGREFEGMEITGTLTLQTPWGHYSFFPGSNIFPPFNMQSVIEQLGATYYDSETFQQFGWTSKTADAYDLMRVGDTPLPQPARLEVALPGDFLRVGQAWERLNLQAESMRFAPVPTHQNNPTHAV